MLSFPSALRLYMSGNKIQATEAVQSLALKLRPKDFNTSLKYVFGKDARIGRNTVRKTFSLTVNGVTTEVGLI